jgi:acetyltransferase-like isoleucine patch superfamily enzyme
MAQPIVSGAGTVEIGHSSSIGDKVQIIFSMPGKVVIGDYCSLGPGVKIICSEARPEMPGRQQSATLRHLKRNGSSS